MRNVGHVIAAGLFQPLGAGHVGNDSDAAAHFAALREQRRDGDVQRDVALPDGLFNGLSRGKRFVEHRENVRRGGAHVIGV